MSEDALPAPSLSQAPVWGLTAFRVRCGLAVTCALYVLARFGAEAGLKMAAVLAAVAALDTIQLFWLGRSGWARALRPCLIGLGLLLVMALLFAPGPLSFARATPGPVLLESPLFLLLACIVASYVSADQPALVWQAAAAVGVAWLGALFWTRAQPGILDRSHLHTMKTVSELLAAVNSPHYFNFGLWKVDLECGVAITAILGLAAYRMRRLARTTALRESERDALASHFSPQVVQDLLQRRGRVFEPQRREVAVMECDLFGFTTLAETMTPEAAADLLGLYRSVVESAVFEQGGAIVGWVGDGVTAVFGLTGGADAARRALDCARRLGSAWPQAAGPGAPRLGMGIDYGPAVMGLVGEGRNVSLILTGPPLETAARLQSATRQVGAAILVSESARSALAADSPEEAASLSPVMASETQAWQA